MIKYKKFDNPDGPVYTLKKSEVFMIKYPNGNKDVFNDSPPSSPAKESTVTTPPASKPAVTASSAPAANLTPLTARGKTIRRNAKAINDKEITSLLVNHPEAMQEYKSAKSWSGVSEVFSYATIGIGLYTMYKGSKASRSESEAIAARGLIFMGLSFVAQITCSVVAMNKIERTVDLYNAKLGQKTSMGLGIQENGIGLGIRF